ncbi:MAG: ABC transporter substrate-binding protein [Candidatus Competibacterales bacterium]|nr:ABC transporter substrate-binding protein [Candidatus Competibacterales bacterium]
MKRLIASVLLLGLLVTVQAQAAKPEAALEMVRDTAQQMLEALEANKAELEQDTSRLYELVREIVLPHFDFTTIARWVMGRHWRTASAEQRQAFTEAFRTLLVRTYAKALLEYSDQTLVYQPLQAPADTEEVTVRSEIRRSSGPAIPIHYELHYRDGAWKVYDVAIDGVSLVTNYRSSLGSQIDREGIDSVIQRLRERNAERGS